MSTPQETQGPEIDWEAYLSRTRWFGGKGRPFRVASVLPLAQPAETVTVHLVTVEYTDDEGGAERYQVPLSSYDEPQDRIAYAFVGSVATGGGVRHVYDGVHDREAMALWLAGFVAAEETGVAEAGGLRFRRVPGTELDPELVSSPLTGEQSNSSLRFDDTAIMKLFRKVGPGVNPDIEIHEVLTRGGSGDIAALYGWVEADLPGEAGDAADGVESGSVLQLAMIQEFLRTATDGFELATGSVRTLLADLELGVEESGGDFAGEAARLGEALAAVHRMLRESFPVSRAGTAELAAAMTARLDQAARIVPEIGPYADRLRAVYDAVAALGSIEVQRVHGDLHLGQTLRTTDGWKLVDFEGEPGRPFVERVLPDSPWRDVAGMLRSFDYAARVVELGAVTGSGADDADAALRAQRAREWSARARRTFLEGYVAALGSDAGSGSARGVLLDAYVADKAVYEAVYEKRNRPTWIGIPLAALERIGAR